MTVQTHYTNLYFYLCECLNCGTHCGMGNTLVKTTWRLILCVYKSTLISAFSTLGVFWKIIAQCTVHCTVHAAVSRTAECNFNFWPHCLPECYARSGIVRSLSWNTFRGGGGEDGEGEGGGRKRGGCPGNSATLQENSATLTLQEGLKACREGQNLISARFASLQIVEIKIKCMG